MRERVLAARELQSTRGFINAEIPSSQIRKICPLDDSGERTLELAVKRQGLSARQMLEKLALQTGDQKIGFQRQAITLSRI
ncbi:MAG: hypothetical protein KJZ84_09315 [Bryobacteraceae bacterium]|nr:hypothetical protein [Bryobacteraceae bacterium]